MFWFIIAVLLILIGLAWRRWGYVGTVDGDYITDSQGYRTRQKEKLDISFRPLGWIAVGLGVALILLNCLTVVGARNVGVERFTSATTGRTLDAGLHLKAPWNSVTDMDASINPEEYKTTNPIEVKIGDLGEAKVALSYRWRLNADKADIAYKDYRKGEDTDGGILGLIRTALVTTNIKAALNEELGAYNPLANVKITADMTPEQISKVTIPPIPYKQLNYAVSQNLKKKIAKLDGLVSIKSVTISHLKLPDRTQDKINSMNTKIQDSRNTLIDVSIKAAQARGNKKLATSLDDPNVLVSKCLDGLIEGDFTAPAGFSCWQGGGSGVVIPSTK